MSKIRLVAIDLAKRCYQVGAIDESGKVIHNRKLSPAVRALDATRADDRGDGIEVPLLRVLTDRGTEYCGKVEQHDYQPCLAVNDIDHTRTKAQSPQTNGICERFHKTILNEFYQVAFRKKI